MNNGSHRLRVGLRPTGRAPARAKTPIVSADGTSAGDVTSGGFSPTLEAPIAMGYVRRDVSAPGSELQLLVRDNVLPAEVVSLPFVPHRFNKA